jgi:AhpD family alkylhydroperoxidase
MPEHYYHSESSKQLRKLRQLKPELFSSFIDFDKKVFAAGALDVKTKEMIAVATAHITQCAFCIDFHTKKAKNAGASEAEIAEAIFVAMAIGASASFTHAAIAMGALEPERGPAP